MTPFLSVVIPLYNKEYNIEKTIRSVLAQTFQDFELIIINDGSTDTSLKKVEALNDQRISVFTIKNQGVSSARNYGVSKVQTDYIAFLDADDIWLTNHLENLNQLIEKFPDCGLYCAAYEKQYKSVTTPAVYKNIPKVNGWMGIVADYFASSINNSIAWTSATLVPKTVLETLNGFDEAITLGAGEDTDLWIRVALQYPVAFCNSVTAIHNMTAENRISNSKTELRQFLNLDVYEPFAEKNPSLKIYLDVNRFAIGIQYKLSGNNKKAEDYFNKIDSNSLNKKQRFLLSKSTKTLLIMENFQSIFRNFKVNLTPFH